MVVAVPSANGTPDQCKNEEEQTPKRTEIRLEKARIPTFGEIDSQIVECLSDYWGLPDFHRGPTGQDTSKQENFHCVM